MDPGDGEDRIPAPQHRVVVRQHVHAPAAQQPEARPGPPGVPLVVPRDVEDRGLGAEGADQPLQRLRRVVFVPEVTGDGDEVRLRRPQGAEQPLVISAQPPPVEVRHHGDAQAGEGLRQVRRLQAVFRPDHIAPVRPEEQQRQQRQQPDPFSHGMPPSGRCQADSGRFFCPPVRKPKEMIEICRRK